MNNEVVYVVTLEGNEKERITLGICGSIKTAYNLVKEEVSRNWDYFQYCEESKWRRRTDTALAKSFEIHFEESDDDDEWHDFVITRWEVI